MTKPKPITLDSITIAKGQALDFRKHPDLVRIRKLHIKSGGLGVYDSGTIIIDEVIFDDAGPPITALMDTWTGKKSKKVEKS